MADFTFIDLFAGIGGIRLGFESIGGQCVFTSEWNDYSKKTYQANFGEEDHFIGDIVTFPADKVPDHDVLLAGFPCQPFSIAGVSKKNALGRPHGFECTTQGTLFFDVARIIAAKQPKAFMLENVKNLVSHNKGHTFEVICNTLEQELGYQIFWKVIDGQSWVPQHRERIIICLLYTSRSASACWSNCNSTRYGSSSSSLQHPVCPPASADCNHVRRERYHIPVRACRV